MRKTARAGNRYRLLKSNWQTKLTKVCASNYSTCWGAMRHFTRDDDGALKAFEEAEKMRFNRSDLTTEQNNNYDANLSALIKEYTDLIKKGEGPRLKAK